jgi:hypothetical protein
MDSWLNGTGHFFNPSARVSAVPIAPGEFCIVVDDALANPAGLVGRRTLSTTVRLSLVTHSPQELRPVQWQCHRDRLGSAPQNLRLGAMVAYLFRDRELGGTSFYRSLLSETDTERMIQDAGHMSATEFGARYGLEAGYLQGSNRYFERLAQVSAAWNRMLFYNGDLFHCGDITAPARLSADPRSGRLTLNGFFTCRPAAL